MPATRSPAPHSHTPHAHSATSQTPHTPQSPQSTRRTLACTPEFLSALIRQRNDLKLRTATLTAMLADAEVQLAARDDVVAHAVEVAARGAQRRKTLSNASTQTPSCVPLSAHDSVQSCPHALILARMSAQVKVLKARVKDLERERDVAREVAGGVARWGLEKGQTHSWPEQEQGDSGWVERGARAGWKEDARVEGGTEWKDGRAWKERGQADRRKARWERANESVDTSERANEWMDNGTRADGGKAVSGHEDEDGVDVDTTDDPRVDDDTFLPPRARETNPAQHTSPPSHFSSLSSSLSSASSPSSTLRHRHNRHDRRASIGPLYSTSPRAQPAPSLPHVEPSPPLHGAAIAPPPTPEQTARSSRTAIESRRPSKTLASTRGYSVSAPQIHVHGLLRGSGAGIGSGYGTETGASASASASEPVLASTSALRSHRGLDTTTASSSAPALTRGGTLSSTSIATTSASASNSVPTLTPATSARTLTPATSAQTLTPGASVSASGSTSALHLGPPVSSTSSPGLVSTQASSASSSTMRLASSTSASASASASSSRPHLPLPAPRANDHLGSRSSVSSTEGRSYTHLLSSISSQLTDPSPSSPPTHTRTRTRGATTPANLAPRFAYTITSPSTSTSTSSPRIAHLTSSNAASASAPNPPAALPPAWVRARPSKPTMHRPRSPSPQGGGRERARSPLAPPELEAEEGLTDEIVVRRAYGTIAPRGTGAGGKGADSGASWEVGGGFPRGGE